MVGDKKLHSLRSVMLVFLTMGFAIVGLMFFIVFHTTMPKMLLESENGLLEKQQHSLQGLFDVAMRYTYQMVDDTAQWDETASFAEGRNPDFIKNNWHDSTPLQNYRFNFMYIKNLAGEDVYSNWYDFLGTRAFTAPEGFSDFLGNLEKEVIADFYTNRHTGLEPEKRGRGGVFIFKGRAYSVAAMPIIASTEAEHPSGVLYMGNILDDAYFKDITRFATIDFAIIDGSDQSQVDAYADKYKSEETVTTTLSLPSLAGEPVLLSMSDKRTMYLSGKKMLTNVIMLLLATMALFAAVLYYTANRLVLRPMAVLDKDIGLIDQAKQLAPANYTHSLEFYRLCSSINDMVARLRQSTEAMGVLHRVLNGMDSYIYVVDPANDELLFVNETLKEHCKNLGIPLPDDLSGKCWQILQRGMNGRCPGCPGAALLDQTPEGLTRDRQSQVTGRYYRVVDRVIDWMDGRRVHLHHSVDITESKKAEKGLHRRLQQQSLMADMTRSFITSQDTGEFVNNALRMAGEFMSMSRVMLMKMDSEASPVSGVVYEEWLNPEYEGVTPLKNRDFTIGDDNIVYRSFVREGASHVAFNNPEEARGKYDPMIERGGKAALVVPIYEAGKFWGALSFDDNVHEKKWTQSDIQLCQLISNVISAVFGRSATEEDLLRMSSIVDSSPQFILLLSKEGYFEYVNQGMLDALGYAAGDFYGAHVSLVVSADDAEKLSKVTAPATAGGDKFVFDMPVRRKDGQERLYNISAFMTAGQSGSIGVIGFDITERRELEKELVRAKEQAEESSRAKGDFLSRMSHEMRTPLNAVIGMTHIAKSTDDLAKKEYCLDKIDDASTHLLGVINDILDMSKIEADKFELFRSEFCFQSMVNRVCDVVNFRVEEKSQALAVSVDPSVPAFIEGDEQHLAQVITNLLSNAVKFTPEHGTITLSARSLGQGGHDDQNEHTLEISVTDTGIGISPEQQSRLFTSFEQADGGIARKFGGTGLGLAISKRIVEMMGGRIWIESEENKGSRFIFTIKAKAVAGTEQSRAQAEPAREAAPQNAFVGRIILLAEDNDINREIVLALLDGTGLTIDAAVDGKEAVEAFAANPARYDIVFMDIHMPEVDGYEATRRIRALDVPQAATVPVIAMTANVFKEDIDRCLASGMNDHIGKPVNPAELYEKLAKHLGKR